MKKKTNSSKVAKFNAQYADIQAAIEHVGDELKKNMSLVKKLSKKARKIWQYGQENCSVATAKGLVWSRDVKYCQIKLDYLNWLAEDAEIELNNYICYLRNSHNS